MNKILCFFVSLSIAICSLSLIGCNNSNQSTPKDTGIETSAITTPDIVPKTWVAIGNTDEFGDVSDNAVAIRCSITGTFSNTATTGSLLTGYIFVQSARKNAMTSIRLLEYGSYKATFTSSEIKDMEMKIKVDGKVQEIRAGGVAPNSDIMPFDGTIIADYLEAGKDIQVVIYIGYSTYNFTIHSDNFAEEYSKLS